MSGCHNCLLVQSVLSLYHSELRSRDNHEKDRLHNEEPLVLLPLEVMVKPLELRFRYHFDGERPTNRPDKVQQRARRKLIVDPPLTEAAGVLFVPHHRPSEYVQ